MKSIPPATVVWFRRDLRLSDNPALEAAVARGGPVVAAWVHAPGEEGDSAPGAAARVFLHDALQSFAESLEARGSRLVLRRAPTIKALIDLARETGADAVYANKVWEPAFLAGDAKAVAALRANGFDARLFDDGVLFRPDAMKTTAGGPFRVFTPFWRRCQSSPGPEAPRPAPARIRSPGTPPPSWPLPELRLLPSVPWDAGIRVAWPSGEKAAGDRLSRFLDNAMAAYPDDRDRPDRDGTSRLSPHLHFGCVSARQAWHAVRSREAADSAPGPCAARRRSFASWCGVTSPITSCSTFPRPSTRRCGRSSPPSFGGTTPPPSSRGRRDAPATRWWTRGCGSSGRPGGCTTASGWSPLRSW